MSENVPVDEEVIIVSNENEDEIQKDILMTSPPSPKNRPDSLHYTSATQTKTNKVLGNYKVVLSFLYILSET